MYIYGDVSLIPVRFKSQHVHNMYICMYTIMHPYAEAMTLRSAEFGLRGAVCYWYLFSIICILTSFKPQFY